ncbi:isoaspartyl peptidase/L-asparaginase family protein [Phaeocystidibacter luteus]|uniref:Isoaspartyl peptidase n=1 Tax=Phaeocystidibacter luteus TaxID=911197 RepID=A0A6N6RM95_9FLAO|nr:isoaspartyl peptidase/L-asparaginase [Phaeocystidibacter luteus]KAB2814697.1 isoaspartyl peptidase/L-asparaginase [Phaeocystidibacter luteus]
MRYAKLLPLLLLVSCNSPENKTENKAPSSPSPTILIHGGAGTITKEGLSDEVEAAYERSLQRVLDSGYKWLNEGVAPEEVVARSISMMESDSLFNSGVGAVVTAKGEAELDASIMRGSDLQAGAVSGLKHIEHPIQLAKVVMDSSKHVMLSGTGAEEYAQKMGFPLVDNSLFITHRRANQYADLVPDKMGTVGVVVLDADGNLSAGTSTGGMMMKEYGRIGDSPIIGSGTYADNAGCAVSCTGHGEYFIRHSVAGQLSLRVKHGEDLSAAANDILFNILNAQHGAGGLIALDANGNYTMPFNTSGMFRGVKNADTTFVGMYSE